MGLFFRVRSATMKCPACSNLLGLGHLHVMKPFQCPSCNKTLAVKQSFRQSVAWLGRACGLLVPWAIGVRGIALVPACIVAWLVSSALLQAAEIHLFPPVLVESSGDSVGRGERISLNLRDK
jgi:uncharacterized paraquat-inducible protein A